MPLQPLDVPMSSLTMALVNAKRSGAWSSLGVGASTYAERALTVAQRGVDRMPAQATRAVLVDCGGFSDIHPAGGNLSAADAFAAMTGYYTARRAAGYQYVITTTMPKVGIFATDPAQDAARRQPFNALVRAGDPSYDAFIEIDTFGDATIPADYPDGVHWSATIAAQAAAAAAPVILRYL